MENNKTKVVILKTYEEMDEWEQMECRLGHYMFSKIIDGKIYYRID